MPNRPPNLGKLIDKRVRDTAFNRTPSRVNSRRPQTPSKETPLPGGSGFDKLIKRRADTNNLPGAVNDFGDRITGPAQKNTQGGVTGFAGRKFGNPRTGKIFQTGLTKSGNTVHIYGPRPEDRVVLPKKRAKFQRY